MRIAYKNKYWGKWQFCLYILSLISAENKEPINEPINDMNEANININSALLFWYTKRFGNYEIYKCEPGSDSWMGSSCLYLGC